MTTTLILLALALIGTTIASIVASRRHDQRVDRLVGMLLTERASSDHRIYQLLEQHTQPHPDLTELISLVDRLCQRLQAPEAAVVEHQMTQTLPPSPPAIPFDDDNAFWEAQEPVSKEALAEALMAAEVPAETHA